jgi:hypothetical protein
MSPRGVAQKENVVATHGEESVRFRAEVALATFSERCCGI